MNSENLIYFKNLFIKMKKDHARKLEELNQTFERERGDALDLLNQEKEEVLYLKLRDRNHFYQKKVDTALLRVENGTFGECQCCGDDISIERLRARPMATQCISCKEEEERSEKHLLYEKKSHTLGKKLINQNVIPLKSKRDSGEENIIEFKALF